MHLSVVCRLYITQFDCKEVFQNVNLSHTFTFAARHSRQALLLLLDDVARLPNPWL